MRRLKNRYKNKIVVLYMNNIFILLRKNIFSEIDGLFFFLRKVIDKNY